MVCFCVVVCVIGVVPRCGILLGNVVFLVKHWLLLAWLHFPECEFLTRELTSEGSCSGACDDPVHGP